MNDFPLSANFSDGCARFEAHLSGYLEQELDPRERQFMQQHRSACATCAALVHDLELLVMTAAELPGITPSRDLWHGIADRIETPVTTLPVRPLANVTPIARRSVSVRWFAVAATVLVAVSSAVTWRVASSRRAEQTVASADRAADSANRATVVPVVNADVVYEEQIVALRTIVDQRFRELDSVTVKELKRNLAIIDKAIADSKAALAKDPNSQIVSGSLDRALANKVALMRRVALL